MFDCVSRQMIEELYLHEAIGCRWGLPGGQYWQAVGDAVIVQQVWAEFEAGRWDYFWTLPDEDMWMVFFGVSGGLRLHNGNYEHLIALILIWVVWLREIASAPVRVMWEWQLVVLDAICTPVMRMPKQLALFEMGKVS